MNWIIYFLIYKAITISLLVFLFTGSRKIKTKKIIKDFLWNMRKFNIWKNYQKIKKDKKENLARNIGTLIADFYLEKYKDEEINEQYKKANQDIDSMGISRLELENEVITITLARPGLLIGRHGVNIQLLEEFLKKHLKLKALDIQEENILWSLHPQIPERDFEFL